MTGPLAQYLKVKLALLTFSQTTYLRHGTVSHSSNYLFHIYSKFSFTTAFGDFPETVDNMNLNYQYWKDQQALIERKAKKLSLESTKVSEAEEDAEEEQTFAEVQVEASAKL